MLSTEMTGNPADVPGQRKHENHRQALDMSRAGRITLPDRPGRNLKRPLAAIAIQKRRGKTRHSFLAAKFRPNAGLNFSK